ASFCVCKPGLQSTAYQTAIDYACGQGVDCTPIRPNGQCYNTNNGLQGHCSFAANSYYQKNSPKGATCDFQGAAQLTNSDPSGGGCSFSATSGSSSTSNGTTSPVSTVPTTSPTTPTSTPVSGGGAGIMPITPVSGTGTPTPGTSTGAPTSGTGTSTNPTTTTSPYSTTPNTGNPTSTGVLGGGMGMAPTASSMDNHGTKIWSISPWSVLSALVILAITCM
ncbi:hypothetical protein KSS87_019857, partial [Heliosperma pusillum]